jgi:hypothetical protein
VTTFSRTFNENDTFFDKEPARPRVLAPGSLFVISVREVGRFLPESLWGPGDVQLNVIAELEKHLPATAVERLKPFVIFPIDCKASILIASHTR